MSSDYMKLVPTPAQALVDTLFLEEMEESYVKPLVAELEAAVPGYAKMDPTARWVSVLKLNEPLFGEGDFLEFYGMLVYAGEQLGHIVTKTWGDVAVSQYHPRFASKESSLFLDLEGGEETISDIEYFFRYERDLYDGLPVSYKAALIYTYIQSKVIADAEETARFVLGCYSDSFESLVTGRIGVRPIFGNSNLYRGWNVQIRDAEPSDRFMRALGKYIRDMASCHENPIDANWENTVESCPENADAPDTESAMSSVDYANLHFEGANLGKQRRPRDPNPKTEVACRFIYELERKGVVIDARKGGVGYAGVLAKLQLKYGDVMNSYTPDNLSRVYRDWKKRNGL